MIVKLARCIQVTMCLLKYTMHCLIFSSSVTGNSINLFTYIAFTGNSINFCTYIALSLGSTVHMKHG